MTSMYLDTVMSDLKVKNELDFIFDFRGFDLNRDIQAQLMENVLTYHKRAVFTTGLIDDLGEYFESDLCLEVRSDALKVAREVGSGGKVINVEMIVSNVESVNTDMYLRLVFQTEGSFIGSHDLNISDIHRSDKNHYIFKYLLSTFLATYANLH